MSKTAAELLAELAKNSTYQAKRKSQEKHLADLKMKYALDEKPLVDELNQSGFSVESVWDFVNSKNDYTEAESILVKHLNRQYHPKIVAGIARALAVPEFSTNDKLWESLISLYKTTKPNAEICTPEERGAQEALAVALARLATKARVDSIEDLVINISNGDGIDFLKLKLDELR